MRKGYAMQVECPKCDADIDEQCRSIQQEGRHTAYLHRERIRAGAILEQMILEDA